MEDIRQLVLADNTLRDIGAVQNSAIDMDVGGENDFEVKIRRDMWKSQYITGNVLYIKNSEFGGIIGEIDTDTAMDTVSLCGRTWRGKLDKKIIVPPAGSDYYIVSGELNECINQVIGDSFESYFSVSAENTGIELTNFQFDRYCTMLAGIQKMLKSVGYKLHIEYIQQEQGLPGYVELSAVPIVDYSPQIELSQDSRLDFKMKNKQNGVNHLICLGKGELQDRQVIDLYVQEDGSIGNTPYYTGIKEIEETYEDTSSESDELQERGIERLKEVMNRSEFSMDVASLDLNVEIGDIVGGRDYLTGLYAAKPIEAKIYRVEDGVESLEYKIEGDDK